MYTVIIAEQEHIDNIREYGLFLEPFMKKSQFAVCRWKPEETGSLKLSVPELESTVAQKEEWRALILCDERGLEKKNPFNIVDYQVTEWDETGSESAESYYAARLEAKKAAYRQASQQPLVRLAARLCEEPQVRKRGAGEEDASTQALRREFEADVKLKNMKHADDLSAETETKAAGTEGLIKGSMSYREILEYLEFREYRECALYKKELRDEIRGEELLSYVLPREVLCIAKRHHDDKDYELQCVWSDHDERQYSRFYDWNLYFDKMRYLVFDVDDKNKQTYRSDYIRFLLGVILLAGYPVPGGVLQPNRVYELRCDADEENMALLLGKYNAKLSTTKAELQAKISEIRTRQVKRLTDEEAERIFCANINVPINLSGTFETEDLYCKERFGLSKDCPQDDEETVWMSGYQKNRKAMKRLVKRPPRALKKATDDFRQMNTLREDLAAVLNEFQVEDIRTHIEQEELAMVDTVTEDIGDPREYYEQMEDGEHGVHDVIDRRMRKKTTIFWGILCLALVCVGVIPAFAMNRASDESTLMPVLTMMVIALAGVAVTALICLIVFRAVLMGKVSDYNDTMRGIFNQIEGNVQEYSVYLSHACNIMRGNSVLSYYNEHRNGDAQQVRIYKKHIMDMDEQQAVLKDLFGRFLDHGEDLPDYEEETPYHFDFSRARDYSYPLPDAPELDMQLEFMERGNYVEVPYGIVKKLEVRREELYD